MRSQFFKICLVFQETIAKQLPGRTLKKDYKSAGDIDTNSIKEEKNPWSLELFEEEPESNLGNASVLITNQGIHLIQEPKKPTLSGIPVKPSIANVKSKLQRSASQPHFSNCPMKKDTILKLSRKMSFNYSSTSLIDVEMYESTFYLYSVLWLCVIMIFWKNIFLLPLMPILILYYVIKHTGIYLGLWSYLYERCRGALEVVEIWCQKRHDALVPVPIRGFYHIVHKINQLVESAVRGSMDTVASCVVIFGLIIFLICASVFIAAEVSIMNKLL